MAVVTLINQNTLAATVLPQNECTVEDASFVLLSVGKSAIKSLERQGDALAVALRSAETVVIHGFFSSPAGQLNELVLAEDEAPLSARLSKADAFPERAKGNPLGPLLIADKIDLSSLAYFDPPTCKDIRLKADVGIPRETLFQGYSRE